ncbi:DUF58 domain-containing protein [Magnetospirillum sp. UT-4]|uniref:DUF58 domain-containing protein n=1 Tax=Magnetospirillum sp. UT-4 TaxID=2681467 RepID=UPI0013865BEE|nr:DUF58 domain-containing protein [Magnetospirillum sp. UT-4]CAA7617689.1 conserved hypothetical protein [Magnetospirillum sp. UT-4]
MTPEGAELAARHLAERLPPLLVAAERVAATVAGGAHGRRRPGGGESFWQFRRLQPGDPAAAVDWRRSARGQRLFVRETEWAAAQTVWLWADPSPSMAWSSDRDRPAKADRARLLLLALAALLLKGGERVALLPGTLAPVTGPGALARVAEAMLAQTGEGAGLPPPGRLPRDAELVLASDFLMPLEQVDAGVRVLAATGAAGHLLQILDPAEETLPYAGRVRFSGCEGEGETLLRRTEDVRDAYAGRLAAHRDGLAAIARSVGWSFGLHRSDHPPEAALLALHARLSGRSGGGRGGGG